MALTRPGGTALVLDRAQTPRGELVLRQEGEHFEVISNGVFLMDTRNGESEKILIRAALERAAQPRTILIGGLGVGFSLIEALQDERVARVTVAEIEPTIIRWHDEHLASISKTAMDDERSQVVRADIAAMLRSSEETYDAICLDVDNGPDWTVTEANEALYGDEATAQAAERLNPGGVLTVWSAARSPNYERVLARHFGNVEVIEVAVPRGEPDVVFIAARPVAQTQGRDSDSS
jgi:spermidine synthase